MTKQRRKTGRRIIAMVAVAAATAIAAALPTNGTGSPMAVTEAREAQSGTDAGAYAAHGLLASAGDAGGAGTGTGTGGTGTGAGGTGSTGTGGTGGTGTGIGGTGTGGTGGAGTDAATDGAGAGMTNPAEAPDAGIPDITPGVENASGLAYQDGIYRDMAEGYNDTIIVKVTIRDGRITDLSAENRSGAEPNEYLQRAVEGLREQITAAQGIEGVDAVSGATGSSETMLTAMQGVIEQATTGDAGMGGTGAGGGS